MKIINRDKWTFLTNHAHVIICVRRNPEIRMRDMATQVGITERMIQRVVSDLAEAGIIEIVKDGRRNRYVIVGSSPLRHSLEAHKTVDDLLGLVGD